MGSLPHEGEAGIVSPTPGRNGPLRPTAETRPRFGLVLLRRNCRRPRPDSNRRYRREWATEGSSGDVGCAGLSTPSGQATRTGERELFRDVAAGQGWPVCTASERRRWDWQWDHGSSVQLVQDSPKVAGPSWWLFEPDREESGPVHPPRIWSSPGPASTARAGTHRTGDHDFAAVADGAPHSAAAVIRARLDQRDRHDTPTDAPRTTACQRARQRGRLPGLRRKNDRTGAKKERSQGGWRDRLSRPAQSAACPPRASRVCRRLGSTPPPAPREGVAGVLRSRREPRCGPRRRRLLHAGR